MTTPTTTVATTKTVPHEDELQLLRLMGDLVSVMEREIIVVEERLSAQLPELVTRKQRLLVDYQAEFKAAIAQPDWLAQLPAPQLTLLRQASVALHEVSDRNARVLKAAVTGTQRLLHGIMNSVREERCVPPGYGHLVQPNNNTNTHSVIFNTTA